MRRHTVRTKHPKYKIPFYERGGRRYFILPPERVEFPLNDPVEAEESINQIESYWDESNIVQKQMMVETLKQGALGSKRLIDGRLVTDPHEQMNVHKTYLTYLNAYQAFSARLDEY